MTDAEKKVHEVLETLGISYTRHEHPAVFTVEQAEAHWANIQGAHCKNLFLRNQKGSRHYLVILPAHKSADLKKLAQQLGEDNLSFASPERLLRFLGLEPGSVSPFGLINNSQKDVNVVIDLDLKTAGRVNFHPNANTATLGLSSADFDKFLSWTGHNIQYIPL